MPVTCPKCGGPHPGWDCKKPAAAPLQAIQDAAKGEPEFLPASAKEKKRTEHRLVTAAKEAADLAKHGVTHTTRTAEELEKALDLPPGTVERWKKRLEKKRLYMREYLPAYRARKREKKDG